MKKTAKVLLLLMFIAVLVCTLTGCGNKNKENDNKQDKLVATKTETDSYFGEYKQTMEISFKDEKAETIIITYDFASEETAKGITSMFSLAGSEQLQGVDLKQDGTKFIMTFNAKAYAEQQKLDEANLSREYFKSNLENNGYEIQQ